ncbi:MAG TPA: hypothetical protein VFQ39_15605 [Longimicrobium sp.]|nr:hypothetical protein [Longimicrobium sp.]
MMGRIPPRLRPWAAVAAALAAWSAVCAVIAPLRTSWWDGFVILAAFGALVPGVLALRAKRLAEWLAPATAEALGATRAWIAAILLANVLWEDLASSAFLPRGMLRRPMWLIDLLLSLPIGFDRFLASHGALLVFETAVAVLLALAMVGLFTRWTVPAAALGFLVFASILRSYAWSWHMGLVPLYALLLLSFTPCGDAFSLDRRLRARRGLSVAPARVPEWRYAMGRFVVLAAVAVPYTLAGLSKVRNTGPLWWTGEHMKQMLVATVVEPMHFHFEVTFALVKGPTWVFGAMGLAALLGEVLFALVLVDRRARLVFPAVMAGMHVGILLMQNILFPDLIAIQAIFYDWAPLRARAVAAWARMRDSLRSMGRVPAPALAPAFAASSTAMAMETAAARGTVSAAGGGVATGDEKRPALDRSTLRQAFVARAFLVVAFACWASRTEKFPLTGMQMFSRMSPPEPVEYVVPLARYADGGVEPARFERWIGAMADTRYRWLLRDWGRRPERLPLLREFMDACAARANEGAAPGRRIVGFDLEVRRWDFRAHPADPARGELLATLHHDVRPSPALVSR